MRMFLFATGKGGCTCELLHYGSRADLARGRNDAAGNLHMRVTISR